jgi:Ca2+-binding EF-hand superfamily protein
VSSVLCCHRRTHTPIYEQEKHTHSYPTQHFSKIYYLSLLRFELDDMHAQQIMNVFDRDGNGMIDYDEFVNFCETDDLMEALKSSKKKKKKGTRI